MLTKDILKNELQNLKLLKAITKMTENLHEHKMNTDTGK